MVIMETDNKMQPDSQYQLATFAAAAFGVWLSLSINGRA